MEAIPPPKTQQPRPPARISHPQHGKENKQNHPLPAREFVPKWGDGPLRFRGRPLSRNLNVGFKSGPKPVFYHEIHAVDELLPRDHPSPVTERVRADLRFMVQGDQRANCATNYNLSRFYSFRLR